MEIPRGWRQSKKKPQNLWRNFVVDGNQYTVTVMPSAYDNSKGKWGWLCFGKNGKKLADYFIFATAEDACRHCEARFNYRRPIDDPKVVVAAAQESSRDREQRFGEGA